MSRTAWTYESFESGSDELAQYNEYFDTAEDAVRQAVNLVDEYPDTIAGVRKVEDESQEDFEHPYKFCIATEENRREAERVFGGKFVCAGLCESNRPRGRMLEEESNKGDGQMGNLIFHLENHDKVVFNTDDIARADWDYEVEPCTYEVVEDGYSFDVEPRDGSEAFTRMFADVVSSKGGKKDLVFASNGTEDYISVDGYEVSWVEDEDGGPVILDDILVSCNLAFDPIPGPDYEQLAQDFVDGHDYVYLLEPSNRANKWNLFLFDSVEEANERKEEGDRILSSEDAVRYVADALMPSEDYTRKYGGVMPMCYMYVAKDYFGD